MIRGFPAAAATCAAALHFAGAAPVRPVACRVDPSGAALAKRALPAGAIVPSLGTASVRVFKVGFADRPYDLPESAMAAGNDSVSSIYLAMSRGRFSWAFSIDPDTLLAPRGARAYLGYGFDTLRAWIDQRLAAEGRYPRLFPSLAVIHFPEIGTGFAGYASGSNVYLNGPYAADVLSHELGHTLGLAHARSLDPGGARISPLGAPATENEYGHAFDLMGSGRGSSAHFNVRAKARLGWLDPAELAEGAGGGVFRLAAADGPAGVHPRALRVATASGDSALSYWIEYRAGLSGVLLQCTGYRDSNGPASSTAHTVWLLAAGSAQGDPRGNAPFLLPPGAVATDAGTGLAFRVRVLADGSGWADVEVIRPGTAVRAPTGAKASIAGREIDALGRWTNRGVGDFRFGGRRSTSNGSVVGEGSRVRAEGE